MGFGHHNNSLAGQRNFVSTDMEIVAKANRDETAAYLRWRSRLWVVAWAGGNQCLGGGNCAACGMQ